MAGLTNLNPFVLVNCATSTSSEGLVFGDKKLIYASGDKVLAEMLFDDFFQPATAWLMQEFVIPAGTTVYIEPANLTDIKIVVIRCIFPYADGTNEDLKWLNWTYPSGGQTMKMGRLTILSGATLNTWDLGASPGGLSIENPQTFDVTIRTLMVA